MDFKMMKMKPKYILLIGIFISGIIVFDSCRKEEAPLRVGGCNDPDSPENSIGDIDYDDASCLYGFITGYEIAYHPRYDNAAGTGTDWDLIIATEADLILRIKQDTAAGYFFESFEQTDQAYNDTAKWGSPFEYKLVNATYVWDLYDVDVAGGDDLVAQGTFNAIENAANGVVTTIGYNPFGDSTELRITYDLRKDP
jgi:hypothetical protein